MRHLDEGTLQAWLDRERSGLSALERDEIGLHLAGCATCRSRLEEIEALSARAGDLLGPGGLEEEAIPPYGQVVARARELEAVQGKRPTRRSPWVAGEWAASVVVALGVGWMANALLRTGAVPDVRVQEMRERAGEQAQRPIELPAAPAPGGGAASEAASEAGAATATNPSPAPPPVATAPPAQPVGRERPSTEVPSAGAPVGEVAEARRPAEAPEPTARGAAVGARGDQGRVVVSGRVTDPDGRPLSAAQVFVEGTGSGTLTNVDGRFQLQLDPAAATTADDLTLTALLIGYATEHRSLRLDSGDVVADFELPQAAVALDQIVVTGTGRRDVTAGPPEIVLAPGGDARSWVEVTRAEAEERAGFGVLTVPGLRVLRIQVQEDTGVPLVRVVQELEGGGVLDLVEARGPLVFDPHAAGDGRTRDSIRRGGVTIAAAAPVDAEALRALLERVR